MRAVLLATAALLLGGCAALKSGEQVDLMRLAPRIDAPPVTLRPGGVVVAPIEASGAAAGRRYTYVLASDPLLLRQAATMFWELPPAETVRAALIAALRTRFAGMDGTAAPVGRLTVRLVRFEEVSGDGNPRAVVALDATLASAGGASAGRYCRATPITANGSGARAAAFQDSVAATVLAVSADVAADRLTSADC